MGLKRIFIHLALAPGPQQSAPSYNVFFCNEVIAMH